MTDANSKFYRVWIVFSSNLWTVEALSHYHTLTALLATLKMMVIAQDTAANGSTWHHPLLHSTAHTLPERYTGTATKTKQKEKENTFLLCQVSLQGNVSLKIYCSHHQGDWTGAHDSWSEKKQRKWVGYVGLLGQSHLWKFEEWKRFVLSQWTFRMFRKHHTFLASRYLTAVTAQVISTYLIGETSAPQSAEKAQDWPKGHISTSCV